MVDHKRVSRPTVPRPIIGPDPNADFSFAFMPIFQREGKSGDWILHDVHPPDSWGSDSGMLVPQLESSSHTKVVFLVFERCSKQLGSVGMPEYSRELLGTFFAASTGARVKLCCRILENVGSPKSIKDRFEGEISRYLEKTTNGDDNIQWLDSDETQEGVNKEPAAKHGLSPRHHQLVVEDRNENCKARVSLSLQNVRNQQLVAPVEITFYDP
jgi:hypothetical protein